jgi:two-component system, OmpR family, response regulator
MPLTPLDTLLYVDDEPDIREVVEMSLGLAPGLNVHTCESGDQALELLPHLVPDLILLDVMMPGLDGPATLAKIRELPGFAQTPVIFVTAKAMPQEVARFRSLGAVAVIPKPFDPMQLANQVIAIWKGLPDERG